MPQSHKSDPGPAGNQCSERWRNPSHRSLLSTRPNVTNGGGAKQAKSRCAQIAPHPRTTNQPLDPEVCRRDVPKSQETRRVCFRNDWNQPGRSRVYRRKSETVAGAREGKVGLSEQLSPAQRFVGSMASAMPPSHKSDPGPAGNKRSHPSTPDSLDSRKSPAYSSPSPRCRAPKSFPRKSFRVAESRLR